MAGDSLLRAAAVGVAAAVVILLAATGVFVAAGPTVDDRITEAAQGQLPVPQPKPEPEPVLPPTPLKSRTAPLPEPAPIATPAPTAPTEDASAEVDTPPAAPAEPPSPKPGTLAKHSPKLKPATPPEGPTPEKPAQSREQAATAPTVSQKAERPVRDTPDAPAAQQADVAAKGAKAPTVIRPGASETFGRDVRLHLEPGVLAAMCDGGHYELQWRMASLDKPGKSRKSEALPALPRQLRCRSNRASQAELPARFFGAGAFEFRARHSWPENRDRAAGQGAWSRWRGFQVLPP